MKVHKKGNPLRPIIFKVTSPTFKLVIYLYAIITQYVLNKYILKSTSDSIKILKIKENNGKIASLDVESLFI